MLVVMLEHLKKPVVTLDPRPRLMVICNTPIWPELGPKSLCYNSESYLLDYHRINFAEADINLQGGLRW